MTPVQENRLYALTVKQKDALITSAEIVELLRLSQRKARETIARNKRKRLD